jgi:hypothetical protein
MSAYIPGRPRAATLPLLQALAAALVLLPASSRAVEVWSGLGGDAQHSAISSVASQALDSIIWQTRVDLAPQYSGDALLIHYGSSLVTQANTVIVPVKVGTSQGFEIDARSGANGNLLWSQSTDYVLPPLATNWVPSYSPALTSSGRIYFAGAGGTVYWRDTPDSAAPAASGQLAFYGLANYSANKSAFDANIFINTPITADAAGNIYFGYQVQNSSPQVLGLTGGVARIDANGNGTYIAASSLVSDMSRSAVNAAPALSADGSKVYFVLSDGSTTGRLVSLNSSTLALQATTAPLAAVIDQSSASPTVGPDGDVYFGTNNGYHGRGVLNHFSANLSQVKTAASFGWDDTASIVPRSMVPSYHGSSAYLLLVKYNDYAGVGGTGVNRLAIVDPNDLTQVDPVTGATVMKEVLTIAGVTPDGEFPGVPGAVREWCINTAAVDPATGSVLVNSEDGRLYRWNLSTNTFTESITLTAGVGEAYTPTLIGADGKVYAINNAMLFAVGAVPEAGTATYALAGLAGLFALRRQRRRRAA